MKINIGRRIRSKRQHIGMTQLELAKKMNVDARTISSWETDRTEPKQFQIQQLCQIFKCEEYELTGLNQPSVEFKLSATDKTVIEMYHKLSSENQKQLLLYMMELRNNEVD